MHLKTLYRTICNPLSTILFIERNPLGSTMHAQKCMPMAAMAFLVGLVQLGRDLSSNNRETDYHESTWFQGGQKLRELG